MTQVHTYTTPEELGRALAAEVVERRPHLLGCPGGRSLRTTYRALGGHDLRGIVGVMMDEYVGAAPEAHYSCARFAREEIPLDEVWLPDPDEPAAYEERIAAAGGIDLFLLASGASDGHVAFLGPGSPRDGRTSVVEIAESTRHDNLATFPAFRSLDDVPRRGVSVGLATIADARALRLVLHGADKRAAAERLLSLDRYDPSWPASIVHEHPDAAILLDREAAP